MNLLNSTIKKLIKDKITLAIAESCTGGLISSKVTSISGVSKIYKLGVVCYSNESKISILNIDKKNLKKYGAVSSEVAKLMVKKLYKITKCKICISTTGVAGPNGGSKEKPVGLVFIGIKYKNNFYVFKKKYNGNRKKIQNDTMNDVFKKINQLI